MVNKSLIIAIMFLTTLVIFWNITKQRIYAKHGVFMYNHFRTSLIRQFASRYNVPDTHVELFVQDGTFKNIYTNEWLKPAHYIVRARPFVGDHIHMAISFWIHGKSRNFREHDRLPIEEEPYEQKRLCASARYNSIYKNVATRWCSLIVMDLFMHPWSAPRTLRQEGLDVTLGLWFDQVGIRYSENPPLEFADGTSFTSNETTHGALQNGNVLQIEHERIPPATG